MNNKDLKNSAQYAWNNFDTVKNSTICGCFHCVEIINKNDINEWTDYGKTAICPKCGRDTIVPQNNSIIINLENLKKIHDYRLLKK